MTGHKLEPSIDTAKPEKDISAFLLTMLWAMVMLPIFGENAVSSLLRNASLSKMLSSFSCLIILIASLNSNVRFNVFHFIVALLALMRCFITLYVISSGYGIRGTSNNAVTPYGMIAYLSVFLLINIYTHFPRKLRYLFSGLTVSATFLIFMNIFITSDLKLVNITSVLQRALSTHYGESRWLFGHRNNIYIQHLLWMLFSCVNCYIHNRSYRKLFFVQSAVNIFVAVLSGNATMLLCAVLMVLMFSVNIFRKISIRTYIFTYAVLEIGIVFLRVQNIFDFILVDMLHRNLTFTGRTHIWDAYIAQYCSGDFLNWMVGNLGVNASSANTHNMFLGLVAYTGLIGTFLYCCLIYLSSSALYRARHLQISKIMTIILFMFLINSITMEFYNQIMLAMYIGYEIIKIRKIYLRGGG